MGPFWVSAHQDLGASADPYRAVTLLSARVLLRWFIFPIILHFHETCQLVRRKALVPPGDLLPSSISQGIKHFSTRPDSRQLQAPPQQLLSSDSMA